MYIISEHGLNKIITWISAVMGYFIVCTLDISEAVKIIEMKSNRVTSALPGDSIVMHNDPSHRQRRSLFSTDMEDKLLDKHNQLRRLEYSSNMELFKWNDYLALMADDWARGCLWKHGQPYRDPSQLPFSQIGQNLYVTNGSFDASQGLQLFYDEVQFYDYETGACSSVDPPCGHYTQMVWATSREVGCAFANCTNMLNIDLINANYLVCNYGPTGNFIGQKPYKKGPACTQCESGEFWCDNGLCNRDCTRQSTKCECRASCHNCGTVIRSNCTCACADGWHGSDCSVRCEDTHEYCGVLPGWPVSWCNVSYVREFCPAMCSLCKTTSTIQPCDTTTTTTTSMHPDATISVISGTPTPLLSYFNMFSGAIIQVLLMYSGTWLI